MILSCVIASSSLLITSSIKIKHVNKYTLSIKIWCKQKKLNSRWFKYVHIRKWGINGVGKNVHLHNPFKTIPCITQVV
jgi:hypothetical protein